MIQNHGEKDTDGEINFKPLTAGLGFHPFSDGMPYAPNSPTQRKDYSKGSGATAAGRPSFAYPTKTAPVMRVPVATPPQLSRPSALKPPAKVAPAAATVSPQIAAPTELPHEEPRYGFIYVCKRILAFGVDLGLNLALAATALSFALVNEKIRPDFLFNPGVLLVSVVFFLFFNWALVTAQEVAFGTSVGKRLFGLVLQGGTSAIFLRAFFFLPSFGFFGVGLLWALFDRRRRCWHDMIIDLQPSEVARL